VRRPALEVADIFRDHGPAWRAAQRGHLSLGQLKVMACQNKAVIFGLRFDVAAEVLLTIPADPKHHGAAIGATLVLHTWGSALTHPPWQATRLQPPGTNPSRTCRWSARGSDRKLHDRDD
jgi:hypothetical protein